MNVFRFELRRAWVGILVWTLVLTALLGGIIAGALHDRYVQAYERGEKASFLRYNSVVFVTEKPA